MLCRDICTPDTCVACLIRRFPPPLCPAFGVRGLLSFEHRTPLTVESMSCVGCGCRWAAYPREETVPTCCLLSGTPGSCRSDWGAVAVIFVSFVSSIALPSRPVPSAPLQPAGRLPPHPLAPSPGLGLAAVAFSFPEHISSCSGGRSVERRNQTSLTCSLSFLPPPI